MLLAAALTSAACESDVNITGPEFPTLTPQWQSFQISGTLTAAQASCLEATILYDGQELPGARAVCGKARGCKKLHLQAVSIGATPGPHTIAFRVLRQSAPAVEYEAEGLVVAELGEAPPKILGPVHKTLEEGQGVTFDFNSLP